MPYIIIIGGLGIFLLGMVIMTDALKTLAGDSLRAGLMRFTRTPATGAVMGVFCTAVLQSSSATTVAAVGFVGAELMSFQNALGVIFGANLGTTLTGWLVALLGFKVKLGVIALPIVFVGTVLKLFRRGRISNIGFALAGFGLIFVGVTTLQEGMAGLQAVFDFSGLPGDSLSGRIQLVLLGVAFTLVTQSSSAGIAAVLSALFAGLIQWQHGAAIVIGMDIGTTVTAALATIGGSIDARRTGFSHVIYNLGTGLVALFLITPFQQMLEWIQPGLIEREAELALVGFHSSFNLIGVILVLPCTRQFERLIVWLFPAPADALTRGLEDVLLSQPGLALNAVQRSVLQEYQVLLSYLEAILSGDETERKALADLQRSLDETHRYLDLIIAGTSVDMARLRGLLHALDHLQRLHERCEEESDRAITASTARPLESMCQLLSATVSGVDQDISSGRWMDAYLRANRCRIRIEEDSSQCRDQVTQAIADSQIDVPQGTDMLEAIRWTRRVSRHLARINYNLNKAVLASGA
ncbi:Na/Pi cotransporter family protein [Amphritea sp. HPY]|uniref:Na/Pi cotransporter family protein n=1 Tax=Amphritea sp. HPY TaxID=3421652 RepID=UPI003D7D2B73